MSLCVYVFCSAKMPRKERRIKQKKRRSCLRQVQRKYYLTFKLKMVCSVSFSKLHHGICYCIIQKHPHQYAYQQGMRHIAVMIFCAQPYLKPCFMCPFYILSTCPSKGLCTALALSLAIRLGMVAGGQAHSAHLVMVSTTE